MKTRLLCLALAAPALIAAQQPAPLPPNPITAMFRTRMVNYQRQLAQAFDSIPESKFGYKPTPAQQTIGYVAQHLAADNYFYVGTQRFLLRVVRDPGRGFCPDPPEA